MRLGFVLGCVILPKASSSLRPQTPPDEPPASRWANGVPAPSPASLYQKVPEKNPVSSGSHFSVTLSHPPSFMPPLGVPLHWAASGNCPLHWPQLLGVTQAAPGTWGQEEALLCWSGTWLSTPRKASPSPCCPRGADAIPMVCLRNRTARPELLPREGP